MNKRLAGIIILTGIILAGVILFLENTIITTSILSDEISEYKTDSRYVLKTLAENTSTERTEGWMNNKVIFSYEKEPEAPNAIYSYDSKTGKKDLMVKPMDLFQITPRFSNNNDNLLLLYKTSFNNIAFGLSKESEKDFSYGNVNPNDKIKSYIEIYNNDLNSPEKIFEYQSRARIPKLFPTTLLENFQDVNWSNNGLFVAYCLEEEIGQFLFGIYNVKEKSTRECRISGLKDKLDFIENLCISNDGNVVWFLGLKVYENYMQKGIYKLEIEKSGKVSGVIASEVDLFQFSGDDRYILYYNSEKNDEISCMDSVSMQECKITENAFARFDLSAKGSRIAYLIRKNKGAELYTKDFENEDAKSNLIHSFDKFSNVSCIKWINNDKSLLISYFVSSGISDFRKTCILDLL